MKKRSFLHASLALLAAASTCNALAQPLTPLKFQLDWRFEGPAALFVHPEQKGYFKQAGLDVTVEAASGAGPGAGAGATADEEEDVEGEYKEV